MKTDNRKFSSPENAKHSTGPKTEQGKARSATNATSHGAYTTRLLLPGEREEDLQQLIEEHYTQWRPHNPLEQRIVKEMAIVLWRTQRISRSETALIDIQMQRMQPSLEAEFAGLTPEALYALAHHALLSHNGAAAALARQERRLLRQYAQLRAELETLRNQPPVEQPTSATPGVSQGSDTKIGETNLNPTPLKVTNPAAIIYQYLPPTPKPPAAGTSPHPPQARAAS